jgi:hypothetical protein
MPRGVGTGEKHITSISGVKVTGKLKDANPKSIRPAVPEVIGTLVKIFEQKILFFEFFSALFRPFRTTLPKFSPSLSFLGRRSRSGKKNLEKSFFDPSHFYIEMGHDVKISHPATPLVYTSPMGKASKNVIIHFAPHAHTNMLHCVLHSKSVTQCLCTTCTL